MKFGEKMQKTKFFHDLGSNREHSQRKKNLGTFCDLGPGNPDSGPGNPDSGPGNPDSGPGDQDLGQGTKTWDQGTQTWGHGTQSAQGAFNLHSWAPF